MIDGISVIGTALKDFLDGQPAEKEFSTYDLAAYIAVKHGFETPAVASLLAVIRKINGHNMASYFTLKKGECRGGPQKGKTIIRTIWHAPKK